MKKVFPKNARILDVGCGSGALLTLMKKWGPKTWELHGNDLNTKTLEKLRSRGLITHSMEVHEIALDGYFDGIILSQVIEHFSDVRGLLSSVRKLLKPGGTLFIETPSTESWDAEIFSKSYWGGYHFPRHFFLFNGSNLKNLLSQQGFEILGSETYLLYPIFWIQSLHHLLLDKGRKNLARLFVTKNVVALAFFSFIDLARKLVGKKTSNMRMIAKRM